MTDYTIQGAGVAGLCLGAELQSRGQTVTLFDTCAVPGRHACSWWAGGMLAPGCESESAPEPVARLGQASADWWQAQGAEVHRHGTLVVAPPRDHAELRRYAQQTGGYRWVDGDEIAELEPQLAGRFVKGLYFEAEAHLDPRDALALLAGKLDIRQAESNDSKAIDCRGLAARDQLAELRGVRGEMLVLRCPGVQLQRPVRLLHPRIPLYIVPRANNHYMLGATMIESDGRQAISARSLLELLSAAWAIDPAFGEAEVVEIGVDARPAFPDNLPRVVLHQQRLYVNGLFRHGYLMAPVLARTAADWLIDRQATELFHEY